MDADRPGSGDPPPERFPIRRELLETHARRPAAEKISVFLRQL